jgi:glycosyltransferase involved in cell wall biosynthesis
MQSNLNAKNLTDGGLGAIAGLARTALAIELRYGSFEQLAEIVDDLKTYLLDGDLAPEEARRLVGAHAQSAKIRTGPGPQGCSVPALTPSRGPVKMTIGMPTYDDYDGVYFSLQSLRLYHPEVVDDAELIVVDNNPGGKCAEALRKLEGHFPNYRYIPHTLTQGTSVAKQRVFSEASGTLVLCMDSHVLLPPGALRALLDYFDANPGTRDLMQGPLLVDNLKTAFTHLSPVWRGGMFGTWDSDDRGNNPAGEPFEIPMQGLGLFACRKDAWPGFNPRFRGFGGEEGYIHEKFRKAGGRTLCLPALRWIHRFDRPMGVPYRNVWEDRIWNYLLGFTELGLDTSELEAHFSELLGSSKARSIFRNLKQKLPKAA